MASGQQLDKAHLLQLALEAMGAEVEALRRLANATRQDAVHEEARPENDKDTRALEQTYLARGQAERAVAADAALKRLQFLELIEFPAAAKIALSGVVELEVDGKAQRVFLVPAGGGLSVSLEGERVQLVTPEAPLGRALIGKAVGDSFELTLGGVLREYEILGLV